MAAQQPTAVAAKRAARGKGPRPRHVPQRMCVACREHAAKRMLIRLVRTPEGTVEVDPTGKRNGRGAYLCERLTCWQRSLQTGGLARALKTTIAPEAIEDLMEYAATLAPPEESGAPPPREGAI